MLSILSKRSAVGFVAILAVGGFGFGWYHRSPSVLLENTANAANKPPAASDSKLSGSPAISVNVEKPHEGGIDRTCVVSGSIHAFESAELFAKVSGYLLKLNVDIGDRVKQGQLLAELDSPEFHRDVDRRKADVEKADAQVGQMKARIVAAEADYRAVEAGIARAEAGIKRDKAAYVFREKQLRRFEELVKDKAVDWRLVDEKQEQELSAAAAVDASEASLAESKAQVASAAAQIEKARADLVDAEAEVDVAKANLEKAKVFAGYTQITSPYDGVITLRTFHRGDFIRGADQTSVHPLLTVERTDVVRLVVYVPDSDVPFTHPGADTVTTIETLPGHTFAGKVSRIAFSEDQKTKTMRTEVDLPNDQGLLRNGMFGRTKLILHAANPQAFRIPSSALVGSTKDNKGSLFVVRDGIARKTLVTVSVDNGVYAEVTEGLTSNDQVIVGNNNAITDGRKVETHEIATSESTKKQETAP